MANEKIHEYIDSVVVNDVKGNEIWIDTDTGTGSNWTSKKLDIEILAQILRTHFKVCGQFFNPLKQYITGINREQQIEITDVLQSSEINLVSNGIIVPEDGLYRVSYILQFGHVGGTHAMLYTWMKIDGQNVDVSGKNTYVHSNEDAHMMVNEMIVQMGAQSELTLWMLSDDTNVLLTNNPSSATIPLVPSVSIIISKL
jgi:hypothetical protein